MRGGRLVAGIPRLMGASAESETPPLQHLRSLRLLACLPRSPSSSPPTLPTPGSPGRPRYRLGKTKRVLITKFRDGAAFSQFPENQRPSRQTAPPNPRRPEWKGQISKGPSARCLEEPYLRPHPNFLVISKFLGESL